MAKKCEFRKKNGERCGADAQTGNSLCVFHDPDKTSEGRRARLAGGITRSRSARKEGSGGYVNSRADLTMRVSEIRSVIARAAENDAATKMTRQRLSIDIDRNDIIMGLADIAQSEEASDLARVAAWTALADIFLLTARSLSDLKNFIGWTQDEINEFN